jgi:hypothetical protein
MNKKRKEFKKTDKIKMLLWCDRHCCLCDKPCGIDIEIAHIKDKQDNSFDNGIPVCYDCHSKIGMYNELHPLGSKITAEEIKQRREQIFDKYTRQYMVPMHYIISSDINPLIPSTNTRAYPDITFNITNLSDYLPSKLRVSLNGMLNDKKISLGVKEGLYTGVKIWNLNPKKTVNSHFIISNKRLINLKGSDRLEIRVSITQTDILGREHSFLEDGYVFNKKGDYWYFEP